MDDVKRIKMLEEMGFSKIESLVYFKLLKKSPLTGYKIAAEIGKSNSNTYLALENLVKKNAVSLLEGKKTKEYAAVPVEQFLEMKIKETQKQKEIAADAFKNLEAESDKNQIYYFKNKEQLQMKAREMIESAQSTILIDSESVPLDMVRDKLEEAGSKGINVIIESTGKKPVPNCMYVESLSIEGEALSLDFDWFVISVDSSKTLASYFTKEGELISGIWMSNVLLSDWFYNGMFYEVLLRHIIKLFKSDQSKEDIFENIKSFHAKYRYKNVIGLSDRKID